MARATAALYLKDGLVKLNAIAITQMFIELLGCPEIIVGCSSKEED